MDKLSREGVLNNSLVLVQDREPVGFFPRVETGGSGVEDERGWYVRVTEGRLLDESQRVYRSTGSENHPL